MYEDFLCSGKSVIGVDHHIQFDEVRTDLLEVANRWDVLCASVNECLDMIAMQEDRIAMQEVLFQP